jgi:excisionase family DNA binding protein
MKNNINNNTPLMTPKEAAKYLGLHLVTVYRLIKKGELPCCRIGGQWRFKRDVLDAWIQQNINTNGSNEKH